MKPVEAFGVAVRTIGLLILLSALWSLLLGVLSIVGQSGAGPGIILVGAGVLLMFVGLGILSEPDKLQNGLIQRTELI